jgi:predicted ferric reductase
MKARRLKQEIYFPIIILVHFGFWAVDLALYQGTYEFSSKHVVGEIFSSWVMTVFAANFLMATRARWVERIFGGLDKMYLIHRRSGIIAAVLLLLHFLVVPRDPSFTVGKPLGFAAFALIFVGVVVAAAPALKRRISYGKWLKSHRLMGIAYLLGVAHAFNVPTLTSELPIVRAYVYGMALIGVGSWVYLTFVYRLVNRRFSYEVTGVERFDNDVVQVAMKPTGAALTYEAGQFAFVAFGEQRSFELHPFTLSSHPGAAELRVSIKALGDETAHLQTAISVGSKVSLVGPYGRMNYKTARHKKQLWLAGGIGITPFLSFAQGVSDAYDVTLIWSVRSAAEANQDEELRDAAQARSSLAYVLHDASEAGHFAIGRRYRTADLLDTSVYICGPEVMREAYIAQLLEKGVHLNDIHYETFSFR